MLKPNQSLRILAFVISLCLLAGAALAGAGVREFLNTVSYGVGNQVNSLTTGDFNNDGKTDIAVPSYPSGIFVFPGNGDGTFAAPIFSSNLGDITYSVAAVDVNGDGDLDLVAPQFLGGMAAVYLGNGDGTFKGASLFPSGGHPKSAVVGDFNGDGNVDLALSIGLAPGGVSILLGTGDGSFRQHVDYLTAGPTEQVAIGDLNGDGKADIVATGSGNTVSVLLGKGDGTFQTHVEYQTGGGPFGVAIADVNADGHADIVTADTKGKKVSVLLGNGNGTFQPRVDYDTGAQSFPSAIALVDFNGDSKIDIAAGSYNANINLHFGMATVLLGNGDGTFKAHADYAIADNVVCLVAADFNRDGAPDIAMPTYGSSLFILLNTGGTRLATTSSLNPSMVNDPVTFSTKIKPSRNGAGLPTGTISFFDGSNLLGTVALSNGQAALTTSSLSLGTHTIVADYSGDGTFNPRAALPILQQVLP